MPQGEKASFESESPALVSVIVPAFNCEETIQETIQSVLSQSYRNLEVIIINDGSTDGTPDILKKIEDPRLRVIHQANKGLSATRNVGICQTKGGYVGFLDADDVWEPEKIESHVRLMEQHKETDLVYSWVTFVDADGKFSHEGAHVSYCGNVFEKLILSNFLICASNAILRRSLIEKVGCFDETLPCVEDWDYYFRCARRGAFGCVEKALVRYRISGNSLSSNVKMMRETGFLVLKRYSDEYGEDHPLIVQSRKNRETSMFNILFRNLNANRASIADIPLFIRYWWHSNYRRNFSLTAICTAKLFIYVVFPHAMSKPIWNVLRFPKKIIKLFKNQ